MRCAKMVLALSTGSLHNYGLNRVFALAAEAGFEGLEIMVDERWDTRQADYLTHLSAKYNLPIVSMHEPFHHLNLHGWNRDLLSRLKRTIKLAERVGAYLVVIHPPKRTFRVNFGDSFSLHLPFPVGRAYLRWLKEKLATFQARTPVLITLENMPCRRFGPLRLNHYHLNNLEELKNFAHLTFDTTHWGSWGVNLLETYEQLADRIVHVHLSNYNGREHSLLTDGCLPLAELLRRLKAHRYQGIITVELGPTALQAENEGKVRTHLQESIAFCRKHFER